MASFVSRAQSFIVELKRRHVFRVALVYGVVAFGTMQVVSDFFPALNLPPWSVTLVAALALVGFPIAICLAWAYDITAEGVQREPVSPGARRRRRLVLLLVLLAGGGAAFYSTRDSGAEVNALAVLPFENLSTDPDNEYFSDGVTEDVLTQLYKLGGLKVISRTSSMQYKGAAKPIRQIADELRVGAVLEGTVRRDGDRVRITAQLIDAASDRHLWAETYDRDIKDIFSVQSEIAREIAGALKTKLTPEKRAELQRLAQRSVNPQAYEEYLRGRYYLAQAQRAEANKHLQRALELQPDYAPAYAALARGHFNQAWMTAQSPQATFPKLKEAAVKALELDPDLGEAHALLGLYLLHYEFDIGASARAFERAIALAPASAQVRHDYAHFLLAAGRTAESAGETVRAAELDPINSMLQACAGWHRFADGHYQAAIEGANYAITVWPNHFFPPTILGWGYTQTGEARTAIAALRTAVSNSKGRPFTKASLAYTLAVNGERAEAMQILQELLNPPSGTYVSAYDVAVIYAGLGDANNAFTWLKRAQAERASFIVQLGWDPRFARLRADARYLELMRRMGLGRTAVSSRA